MHIYAFGSLCRGEVGFESDVDLLAITDGHDARFDRDVFSIYSYKRTRELWAEGNPFAWHLATEAKIVYASDGSDILAEIGKPEHYTKCREDCAKFSTLYFRSVDVLTSSECSRVFELSCIFLAIRNFATCFSLGVANEMNFSRHSAKKMGERSLSISDEAYCLLERSRILCTRGVGLVVGKDELSGCFEEIRRIGVWIKKLEAEIPNDGRVQQ
jgi:hypothetical protein